MTKMTVVPNHERLPSSQFLHISSTLFFEPSTCIIKMKLHALVLVLLLTLPQGASAQPAFMMMLFRILCFATLGLFCVRFEVPTFPAAAPLPILSAPPAGDESRWYMTLDLQGIPSNIQQYYQQGGAYWAKAITAGVPDVDLTGKNVGAIPGSNGRCSIPRVIDDLVSSDTNVSFCIRFRRLAC